MSLRLEACVSSWTSLLASSNACWPGGLTKQKRMPMASRVNVRFGSKAGSSHWRSRLLRAGRRSKADLKAYRLPGKTAAKVRPVAADWNSGEAAPNRRLGSFAMTNSWDRVPIEPQSVIAPLSRAAVFLVLTVGVEAEAMAKVRRVIADISGLVRTVGFRDLKGRLSCNVGIGSNAWDRLGGPSVPRI